MTSVYKTMLAVELLKEIIIRKVFVASRKQSEARCSRLGGSFTR